MLAPATVNVAPLEDTDGVEKVTTGLLAPGPVIRPDTITYSTAASTTVIATIKIVAMTGDTAWSSLRMMAFMVQSSCSALGAAAAPMGQVGAFKRFVPNVHS